NAVTAEFPDVSGILNGFGPPLPGRLAGLARVQEPGGLAPLGAYGTGFTRFAVIPLPDRTGFKALDAALAAGATRIQLPDGAAVVIRTPLLTVALATSRFGGPVFLLAGAVTPAVLRVAASRVRARSVVMP